MILIINEYTNNDYSYTRINELENPYYVVFLHKILCEEDRC